jgi:hypothetical protein
MLEGASKSRAHSAAGLRNWPGGVPWQGAASAMLGWYDRKAVESVVGPLGRAFEAAIREVAVAPLEGPPGRVDALWVWASTRAGDSEVVRPVVGRCLPPCMATRSGLDSVVAGQPGFVFFHVRDVLYLQLKRLASCEPLFPLAGVPAASPDLAGVLGVGRDLVLWNSSGIDERVIRQARLLGARVGRACIDRETLARYLNRRFKPVEEWLAELAAGARDWRDALEASVAGMADVRVFAYLNAVGMSPSEVDEFARSMSGPVGDGVRRAAEGANKAKPVAVGGRLVEEGPDGWRTGAGALVSSATIRIDEIVRLPVRGDSYYRGVVKSSGVSHQFEAPSGEVDADPARWLDRFLGTRGDALVHDPSWGKRLSLLARHFHKPTVVDACDRVGWDEARRAFHFPRWSLFDGGVARDVLTRPPAGAHYPYDPEPPDGLQLASDDLPRGALAVALALCVDLAMPALGGKSSGVLVTGPCEWLVGLGVPAERDGSEWLARRSAKIAALAEGAKGGRHVVSAGEDSADNLSVVSAIPPAYLTDLLKRRLKLRQFAAPANPSRFARSRGAAGQRLSAVVEDVLVWADKVGIALKLIRDVMNSELRLDGSRADAVRCFADLVAELLAAGELSVVPERFQELDSRPGGPRVVLLGRGRLWLPTDSIDRLLADVGACPVGHERAAELLTSCAGASGFVESVGGRRGVSVVAGWWDQNIRPVRGAFAS